MPDGSLGTDLLETELVVAREGSEDAMTASNLSEMVLLGGASCSFENIKKWKELSGVLQSTGRSRFYTTRRSVMSSEHVPTTPPRNVGCNTTTLHMPEPRLSEYESDRLISPHKITGKRLNH